MRMLTGTNKLASDSRLSFIAKLDTTRGRLELLSDVLAGYNTYKSGNDILNTFQRKLDEIKSSDLGLEH